jgi:hypothetical protein
LHPDADDGVRNGRDEDHPAAVMSQRWRLDPVKPTDFGRFVILEAVAEYVEDVLVRLGSVVEDELGHRLPPEQIRVEGNVSLQRSAEEPLDALVNSH